MTTSIKHVLLLLLCTGAISSASAQSPQDYVFSYDAAGNRTSRECTDVLIKKGATEGVKKAIVNHEISVYPNPATSYLDVKISDLKGYKASIRMTDMSGRTIFTQTEAQDQTRIDVSRQPNGIYIMEIRVDDQITYWKIVKEE